MIIYHDNVKGFKDAVFDGSLIGRLDNLVRTHYQQSSANEIISWRNSLSYMERIINRANVPENSGVAIEYMIPSSSKRIDFILSGYDELSTPRVVIIELKQWSSVTEVTGNSELVQTYVGRGQREVPHPSYQAWSYASLLTDFNQSVEDEKIKLHPCAYLHNYRMLNNDPLFDDKFSDVIDAAPVFTMSDNQKLCNFIEKFIKVGDDKKILYDIENGKIRPSKSLQDKIHSMIQGNQEFIMIDDQKVVFEKVIAMSEKSRRKNSKKVLIVEGGPGTGKTVVAVNLLAELTKRGFLTQYISKNSAPREVYKTKLKGNMSINSIDNLFKGSGNYYNLEENFLDIAIVDEAHRLNEKSGFYGNEGENQIKEIINASSCSVFFVDDNQRVTFKDIGTKSEIIKQARKLNVDIEETQLSSQFRCNGSDGYLAWIDDVLQIKESANKLFDMDYDLEIVDSPHELLEWVRENNVNNKSRIIAGYCWDWPTEHRSNFSFNDIQIDEYNFGISWNLNQGIWAISTDSVNQAGCIHTSQGLEFEYVGVIIGPDMFYDGEIKTDFFKRSNNDNSIKGLKGLYKKNPEEAKRIGDQIIRNTYRTLLTRGMKATRVFCTDQNLASYLKMRRNAGNLQDLVYSEVPESYLKIAEE